MQPQRWRQPAHSLSPVMEAATGWKDRTVPGFGAAGGIWEPLHCGSVRAAGRSACFRIVWHHVDLLFRTFPGSPAEGAGPGDGGRLPVLGVSGKPAPCPLPAWAQQLFMLETQC